MAKNKSTTARVHAGVRSIRENQPPIDAKSATREVPRQNAAFAQDVSEKAEAVAEKPTNALEQTNSNVTSGAADFNQQLIEVVRGNTNATFDFVYQLLGVKSPGDFLELSSSYARQQFQTFVVQSKNVTNLAQKVTAHSVEPLRTDMKSVLSNAA
jgi:hypothetical protein